MDRRPAWLLHKLARISSARRSTYGEIPASADEWWRQICAVAATLKLETEWRDWHAQP
jgi:hypothetical protein